MPNRHARRRLMELNRATISVVVALASTAIHSARGAGESLVEFRAAEIEGEVLALAPWSTQWQRIEAGDRIWAGTLVQSLSRAKMTVARVNGGQQSASSDFLEFTFATSTMLRIHEQLGRRFHITGVVVDARDAGLPKVKSAGKAPSRSTPLINAWRRTKGVGALLTEALQQTSKIFSVDDRERPIQLVKPEQVLHVNEPKDGSIIVVDRFPCEIAVGWKSEGGSEAIERVAVFLWPAKGTRPPPKVRAKTPVFALAVPTPGTFNLQLSSEDGAIESHTLTIIVEGPTGQLQSH